MFDPLGDRVAKSLDLAPGIVEPVGRPYPVKVPAQAFEHLLAQAVALPAGARGMIARPVALHAEDKAVRPIGMANADVDEVARPTCGTASQPIASICLITKRSKSLSGSRPDASPAMCPVALYSSQPRSMWTPRFLASFTSTSPARSDVKVTVCSLARLKRTLSRRWPAAEFTGPKRCATLAPTRSGP